MGTGGAEQILVDLARHQRQQGHSVRVVTLRGEEYWVDVLLRSGIAVNTLVKKMPPSRAAYFFILSLKVRTLFIYVRNFQPSVIHTWMYLADLLGGILGWLLKKPTIWGIFSGSLDSVYYRFGTSLAIKACVRLSRSIPDIVVSCSAYGRRTHAAAGYPLKKVIYIPTGFPRVSVPNVNRTKAGLLQPPRTGNTNQPFRIGMLARISTEKAHTMLLRAFAELISEQYHVCLSLAGGTGLTPGSPLEKQIHGLALEGVVSLEGRIEDVECWMASLDLFVLISRSEGFPTVVGEAMSFEKPCLVSDVGDAKILLGDGDQIARAGDLDSVVEGLKRFYLMTPPERTNIGIRNRCRIEKYFSQELMLNRYDKVYESVLARIKS